MLVVEIFELVVMAISAILVITQVFQVKKQIKESHEEHRRENTTDIMHIWCNSLKKEASMAEEVARLLSEPQCIYLYNHKPFNVSDDKVIDAICKFCPLVNVECSACEIKTNKRVDGKILNELRYHVICYLNMLETVMTSWDLGVVDRATIEEQFKFLLMNGKGMALEPFRRAAGGYPLIGKFLDQMKDKSSEPRELL